MSRTIQLHTGNQSLITASNLTGGAANYIPLWASATLLSSSNIYQSAGNVGIGTASPSYLLDIRANVAAASTPSVTLRLNNQLDGGHRILFSNAAAAALAAIDGDIESSGAGTDDGVLKFWTATNGSMTEKVRIDKSGNVGIGTASPATTLHVQGNVSASSYTGSLFGNATTSTSASYAATSSVSQANTLTGTTLASNVVNSSLTSVGTLTGLTVSADATINNVTVGRGSGNSTTNTVVGNGTFTSNTTGTSNTAVGNGALTANTTGTSNAAVGAATLQANTVGINNTAIGTQALTVNTSGSTNTAIGVQSLFSNISGSDNTGVGVSSLRFNTVGTFNTAMGTQALRQNVTGSYNSAYGADAARLNVSGSFNTAIGSAAMYNNTSGSRNTALGYAALYSNTTSDDNTAIGRFALYVSTGNFNTAIGRSAGASLTTGNNNTIIGSVAGTAGLSDTVIIAAGTTERLRIDSSGQVGVGTTLPGANLHVQGNVSASSYTSSLGFLVTGSTGYRHTSGSVTAVLRANPTTTVVEFGAETNHVVNMTINNTPTYQFGAGAFIPIFAAYNLGALINPWDKVFANNIFSSGSIVHTGSMQIVSGTLSVQSIFEKVSVTSSAAPATLNYNVLDQAILFHSASSTANWTLNFRGNASRTLNSVMSTGQSLTTTLMVLNTATAYSASAYQIDGTSITPRWQGGTSGSANTNSLDAHTFTIIKTSATPTYVLLGSITKYT
jgi:hypothetical protein